MALINLKIFSEELGMQTTVNVVIPQKILTVKLVFPTM